MDRYAISDASADWSVAEAQVANLTAGKGASVKSTIVSVKTTATLAQKRKAEDAGPPTEKKKVRRGMKKDKR